MWNKKWVVGNWKMNGRLQNNDMLLHGLRNLPPQQNVCIGIAPPAVYLQQVRQALQSVTNNSVRHCAQRRQPLFPATAPTPAKYPPKCSKTSASTLS